MRFPDGLRALNHRDYRFYFVGLLVSMIGTWMQSVGQAWLIVELTDSAFLLGLISALHFTPTLVLALFGGALADRLPKRKVLMVTQASMMVLAFSLSALVWSGHVQYWHVALMAFLLGCINTIDVPVRQAFTVEMVGGKHDLGNAVALNSAIFNGARLVGPAAAGLLIGKYGVALAFFLNGASFLAILGALWAIRADGLPRPRAKQSIVGDVTEGLQYAYRTPLIAFLLTLLFAIALFVINYQVLVPVLAKNVLQVDASGYGYLMSSLGAGALTGAFILAFRKRGEPRLAPLVTAALVLCAATASMFFVRSFGLACIGLFVMGVSQILFTADTNTTVQMVVPDELRGRVMSLYQLMFAGTVPFGSLFTGAVIERWGGSAGFLVGGLLGLLLALLLLGFWLRARSRSPRAMSA
ncbi:MAG: MFS transporter [Bacillota bacterium]